jgi:predicted MPP superfamily phosphohydrolase
MKNIEFLIFFSIVFVLYTAINYYIFIRGYQVISQIQWAKSIYIPLYLVLYLSFLANIILIHKYPSFLSNQIAFIGNFWLAAILYLFLAVVLLDILRLINHFIPFFPAFVVNNYALTKQISGALIILTVFVTLFWGYKNANSPELKTIDIKIPKKTVKLDRLRIVAASDVHLRSLCSYNFSEKLASDINKLNPDIILFPGDLMDESIEPVIKFGLGEPLKQLKSKYGTYAITGNHEYIGGINQTTSYIESLGIKILRDEFILIDNEIYLIGREDRAIKQFAKMTRKSLKDIMSKVDKTKPLLLLDHQPFGLNEAQENGIDFQLSGHTHHGQLFPINFITNKIYEVSWGYLKKGNTQYYVSSGYGTWGPPVRTGNHPELLLINLYFEK